MPIRVSCQCGQQLSAKEEYAGKRVKCPGCGGPLLIPQPPANAEQGGMSDLLDAAGVRAGVNRCPGCGAEMTDAAVLCVMCGFDLRRGHRIKARVGSAAEMDDEELGDLPVHGVEQLDKAERMMARDKIQQKNLSKGVPWWMIMLAFLAVVGFAVGMVAMPQHLVMRNSGFVLIVAGALLSFFFGIRLLIEGFRESVVCGILMLVLPFYQLYFVISRWDRVGGIFLFIVFGNVMYVMGVVMVAILGPLFQSKNEADSGVALRAWKNQPVAVKVFPDPARV